MFLTENHLQSARRGSKIAIGLYYNDKLVSLMTFGTPRYNKNMEWELIRFCTLKHTQVIGGASKLMKYFERNYKPTSIISYANLQWSDGNLYRQLGFTTERQTTPSYWWVKDKITLSRNQCQKHKLEKLLPIFNALKTEAQNMEDNGYYKVCDCGNIAFEKTY